MKNFTNKFQLSKTLGFELKPIDSNGYRMSPQEANQVFEKILEQDRKIKAAYDALKPVMDKIHEEIINKSLTSEAAKQIDFSEYFIEYQKGRAKELNEFEKKLRETIGETFEYSANEFAENCNNQNVKIELQKLETKYANDVKKVERVKQGKEKIKPIFKKKNNIDVGTAYLTQAGLLKYIDIDIQNLVSPEMVKDFIQEKEIIDAKGKKKIEKTGHLAVVMHGYFDGYCKNRENYYESKDEKATAVATRIVHENLPKFCDNTLLFQSRKEDYLNAYQYLKDADRDTQIKDAETKKIIEAYSISKEWFQIEKFSACLSQQGIDEYNKVIGHYNLLINLYNQARKKDEGFKKLSQFKTLFKQIGCGKQKLFEQIESDKELKTTLGDITNAAKVFFVKSDDIHQTTIYSFINWLKENDDWDGVYWNKAAVDIVSNKYLANWHSIKNRIETVLQSGAKEHKELKALLKSVATYNNKREEEFKMNDAVELTGLFHVLDKENQSEDWSKLFFKESILEKQKSILDENKSPSENLINLICADIEELASEFFAKSQEALNIIDYQNEDNVKIIKEWLDRSKWLLWIIKYFDVKQSKVKKGNNKNSGLYNMVDSLLHSDETDWYNWYDLVRNYLSKKPQDDAKKNKLKLNFENSNLLGGWSDGEEKNKGAVLLSNGNKKYVGLLITRNIFDTKSENNLIYSDETTGAGRLVLKSIAFKTLTGKGFNAMFDGQKYGDIGRNNPISAVNMLQRFMKEYIIQKDGISYVQKYPLLNEVAEKRYTDKKVFDKEVQDKLIECYENDFRPINWDKVLEFVKAEKMYLFEIYSKDFSETKGAKSVNSNVNLQTKYWQHLFDKNSTIQLNGGGEIFFREKVDLKKEDSAIHPAHQKIERRSDGKKESIFNHDIIKNKRFTANKFFFHVPIKINYQAPTPRQARINETVNDTFTQSSDIQLLGIDRGEKHLIYCSMVDANGNIIKQQHFDIINNKNYLEAINEAAKKRREKQENWQQKGNISNLKDGYISLVIHEIIKMMKDDQGNYKPTFIVMEDLNTGFKRGRQKFEQQVYQKFELALAKKLNYLVDKSKKVGELGSVSKALQLTPSVANYGDIEKRKQVGIILYTRANYTSITDPATGWRKSIYLKNSTKDVIRKQITEGFTEIGMDENGDYFFTYPDKNTGKSWTLWSGKDGNSLERYRFKRGNSKNEPVIENHNVKELLDKLFANFDKTQSLKKQLEDGVELSKVNDHTAWETLRFAIDIIQQIRNSDGSKTGESDNFLQSPVRNIQGEHFDSRKAVETLPIDADANGAYNIARKGIIMNEHIKHWVENGKKKFKQSSDLDLFVSDKEWDLWLSDKEKWQLDLKIFASRKENEKK